MLLFLLLFLSFLPLASMAQKKDTFCKENKIPYMHVKRSTLFSGLSAGCYLYYSFKNREKLKTNPIKTAFTLASGLSFFAGMNNVSEGNFFARSVLSSFPLFRLRSFSFDKNFFLSRQVVYLLPFFGSLTISTDNSTPIQIIKTLSLCAPDILLCIPYVLKKIWQNKIDTITMLFFIFLLFKLLKVKLYFSNDEIERYQEQLYCFFVLFLKQNISSVFF
jgi:hypothetical protein